MAQDVLSVPITTVASKLTFSIGCRVVTKYRNSINHENVQTLVTTRNWLHGFTQSNESNIFLSNLLIYHSSSKSICE